MSYAEDANMRHLRSNFRCCACWKTHKFCCHSGKQKKAPRISKDAGRFESSRRIRLTLLHVDVVSDNSTEHCAGEAADHCTLDLVTARYCADDCTSARADGSVTLGVLDDGLSARGGRIDRSTA